MWKCKHCRDWFDFSKTSEKANHSRWCDKNPKRNNWKKSQCGDTRFGSFNDFEVECHSCRSLFSVKERESLFPTKDKYYCARSCANRRVVTEEHRAKTSKTLTKNLRITDNCLECSNVFDVRRREHRFCSIHCSMKFRNKKNREQRDALTNYRADCAFKFNLKDYSEEFDFALVESYGWYRAKNRGDNLNGVSRDHMVSVRYGFDNNIPSEHLSHPANCKLMRHNDNVAKNSKNLISYEELLVRIIEWDKKYNTGAVEDHGFALQADCL